MNEERRKEQQKVKALLELREKKMQEHQKSIDQNATIFDLRHYTEAYDIDQRGLQRGRNKKVTLPLTAQNEKELKNTVYQNSGTVKLRNRSFLISP